MAAYPASEPVDDAGGHSVRADTLPGMSIDVPVAEVYRLANSLRGAAGDAEEIAVRLQDTAPVGSGLLGDTTAAVANSWLRLDGALQEPHGRASAE
ncbi:hypothetical protein [Blastococcus sp. CT_GayMR16]|uniref:hypothetical protein n=1 Tax=Blastococcus sp. CT_GayMR16 TaxID=2559607 RepID=UPI0010734781|nr:hypothetical protein [Blastococcus sp. CT_GayMR16]TFV88319.1 hypothetical protein E4P38_11265 [Blastococcus sp. CT_GayMR16]